MIHEDQIFVINEVVMDLTHEMVVTNVINRPVGVAMKLNAIAKIYKYREIHEGHHFIPMAMDDAPPSSLLDPKKGPTM